MLFGGKKENFNKVYFNRFGAVLNLNDKQMNGVYRRLGKWLPKAIEMIEVSFLTENNKIKFKELISKRVMTFD